MEQYKTEPYAFHYIVDKKMSLKAGDHVDDIRVSEKQGMLDVLFDQLKQRFPVKNLRGQNMYTGSAFECDWERTESLK